MNNYLQSQAKHKVYICLKPLSYINKYTVKHNVQVAFNAISYLVYGSSVFNEIQLLKLLQYLLVLLDEQYFE